MILRSEFAHIRVELDESGNGPRLRVRDEKAQREIYLDPLELACLASCRHQDLASILDPSLHDEDHDLDEFEAMLRELRR